MGLPALSLPSSAEGHMLFAPSSQIIPFFSVRNPQLQLRAGRPLEVEPHPIPIDGGAEGVEVPVYLVPRPKR